MKTLWNWIFGTIRPLSLLTGIPVLIGALVSNTPIHWDIFYAAFATMLGVGFANTFNNLIDRHLDKLNPNKKTLASKQPIAAWYSALFLLPALAFCLRSNTYNHCLFAILYYLSLSYSYLFGRVRILKRVVVSTIVAMTVPLYVHTYNRALWLFASIVFAGNLARETRKDISDRKEDELMRFSWRGKNKLDWWCLVAPFLAAGIYLGCLGYAHYRIRLVEAVISFGIVASVWSYIQIRYRYKQYRMKLLHQTASGRMGAVIALVGLMPSFVTPPFILVVMANISSIIYRSFLGNKFALSKTAILQDAFLWASLPILAMTKAGYNLSLLFTSLAIVTFVYTHEKRRLGKLERVLCA